MHELPLVIFTVLAQSAVGVVLFATLMMLVGQLDNSTYVKALVVALVLLIIGGGASMFHLGQPLRAFNVLAGVGRSPMSNEIMTTVLFGGLLFATTVFAFRQQAEGATKALSLAASLAGIALLFVIPSIYTIESVAQWNTPYTVIQMVLTALAVGSVMIVMLGNNHKVSYVTMLILLAGMTMMPGYLTYLAASSPALLEQSMQFWGLKVGLAGLAILSLSQVKTRGVVPASFAAVLVLASEFAGRVGFFELWNMGM
ncbi:dimethyl sulfoxide reductase anchor subunit family protein [Thaumasiovibrio sp. DFM-14]|uniref:dimethyl sulfoxide reductase anchor subunit family protein n=1 Tax=Thaumasiovibrio sp. DFM-14 TaxID=3384792 RepID=UPI00399F7562